MAVKLTKKAKEGSTYIVPVTFKKPNGDEFTPDSVRWTLMTSRRVVVNGRRHVSITPDTTVNVVTKGLDLKVTEAGEYADRLLLVEAFYDDPTYGNGLTVVEEFSFQIEAAKSYPVTTTTTTSTTTTTV